MSTRRAGARSSRATAAEKLDRLAWPDHVNNGEEGDYPYLASFGKGLPHNRFGEVEPEAFNTMLRALSTKESADFERIPVGSKKPRRFVNPQAGLAFDLQGPDPQALTMPPAPRVDNARNSAEMIELYWMALCRDVPFGDFADSPVVADAARELSGIEAFDGPRQDGAVTPHTLFRGNERGSVTGPYLSQFLLRDIQYGTLRIPQTHDVVPAADYLTDWQSWLAVQRGATVRQPGRDHTRRRYLHTPRDLAHYVHFDALYEAYLNAALILLDLGAPLDQGIPYVHSTNQEGFGTYGGPHVLSLVTEVATRALKAVWFQKWFVHRRMRPEAFGGRIHAHLSGLRRYDMIEPSVLDSVALKTSHESFGGYLLPQTFAEGSPLHPSYGAGHATVAGACVTVLKAWFDESWVIPDPVVPNADGSGLEPYRGAGRLTVGGELDKVAANVAVGRSLAGVHWRSDYSESIRLGEQIGIEILRDVVHIGHEKASFTLSKFDGTGITIQ